MKGEQEESAYAPASEASGAVNEYHARCSTGTCKLIRCCMSSQAPVLFHGAV